MLPEDWTGLTANIPVGRLGRPEEVSKAAFSLVSNTYVTGLTISVDGGMVPPLSGSRHITRDAPGPGAANGLNQSAG